MTTVALPARPVSLEASPPGSRPILTLIVDDQPVEREVMRCLLACEPDIQIAAILTNGRQAVDAIHRLNPDLVFLDVQMPELDGFGVVSEIEPDRMPAFVFVTANEEFARRAFDVRAVDYLVKPCQRARLSIALQRAREEIRRRRQSGPSA